MEKMRKQFIVAIMALLFLAVLMVTAVMSVPAKEHSDFRFTGNVTQLWDEPHAGANWTNAFSVRDLNGDDKADVLVLTSSYNEATSTETATVIAKRGSDGEHLWEEPVTGTAGTNISAFGAGDLDGDGMDDVLVQISSTERDTAVGTSTTTATVIAKRGYDGEQLWEEQVTGTELFLFALPAGDLDGDDQADVLVQIWGYNETTRDKTATVIAKRGHNGEHLWEESVTGMDLSALPAGDLNGDKIADVLLGSRDQVYALGYREE